MPTAPTKGERGEGKKLTYPIYEGDFTRTDVQTQQGIVKKGGTFAAPISDDAIEAGSAYVREYTSWAEHAYQAVAAGGNGNLIKGRVLAINKNIPEVATNGGTSTASLATARQATVEVFEVGQQILVRADGSSTSIALGDKLSLKAGETEILVQDNTNGTFKALQTTSDADAWILVEVI